MKTYSIKAKDIHHDWYLVDAENKILGRLASQIALRLRGKHKPEFTPHMDTGDAMVVINAEKIAVTGNKEKNKIYYRHTGYPGGIRQQTLEKLRATHPDRILRNAVKGMLPRGPLGRAMLLKLKIYAGSQHPHGAQQPKPIELVR